MIRYVAFQPSAVPPPVVAFLAPSAWAGAEASPASSASPEDRRELGKGEHEPRLPLANSTCQEQRPRPTEVETEDQPPSPSPQATEVSEPGQASPPSPERPRLGFSEFWQPAVRQFYETYLRNRLAAILRALLPLEVGHWRQLLDFGAGFRTFVFDASCTDPIPRTLPWELLQYVWLVIFMASSPPSDVGKAESMPLLYVQLALCMRALCRPAHATSKPPAAGPPPVVQFLVRLLGCPSAASLLCATAKAHYVGAPSMQSWEAWTVAFETAWRSEGLGVLRSCKALLAELYPGEGRSGANSAPGLIGAPMLLAASVLQLFTQMFSGLSLGQSETRIRSSPSSSSKAKRSETPTQMPSMYTPTTESGELDPCDNLQPSLAAMILQCSCSVRSTSAAVAPADRFLLCLADLVEMCIEEADGGMPAYSDAPPEPVDIRSLSRLARVLLQAFFMDPALLAAAGPGSDALAAGAFSGPSDPDEFVPISGSGPLRRSLAFMEQSPLLQVVQRRLCSAHFEDVEGSTEQLTHFALRALRVLWFDLRRSTCTLKRIPCDPQEGTTLLCLLMKPLKLQLCCDCDAELATFPYVRLACGAQVTVKGVVISIEVVASTTGMQLRGVDGLNVVVPELEVKLSDAPLLSRIAVSAVLAIFQTTLQDGKRH
ncbi:unnamed protein product [Symbiodinium sp. CCMP2456]|nr:unnamed protein product [Symbiodinium sp. CCMP2456]